MIRFVLLLLVGFSVSGCGTSRTLEERLGKHDAEIEAARIPSVTLSEQQIAKLKELTPKAEIIWLGAGRKSNGEIFVCHVVAEKNAYGKRIELSSGTFEADGSYQRSAAYLWSKHAVLEDCHAHGFKPPVTIYWARI